MKNKSLLKNIDQLDDFSNDEKKQLAQAFEQGKETPYALAMEKLLKKRIQHYYYKMAHNKVFDNVGVAFLSGRIQQLEEILIFPKEYIENWGEEEEKDGEKV